MLVQITSDGTTDKIDKLRERWANCEGCSRCYDRHNVVHFRGSTPAPILFIAGSPSFDDDELGMPLTGQEGKLLDALVECSFNEAGLDPKPYAVTTIVACAGGDPDDNQAKACRERLASYIDICQPTMLVTLGSSAMRHRPLHSLAIARHVVHMTGMDTLLDPDGDALQYTYMQWISKFAGHLRPAFHIETREVSVA